MDKKTLLIVDAYNILYKAYYGNKSYLNKDGINIGAVYTAFNIIWSLGKFDNMIVVFDGGGGENYRKDILQTYKENRSDMEEDLKNQIPIFKEALSALDIKYITPVSAEADDMAASIALYFEKQNYDITILSGDKDFRQIISDNIKVYDSSTKILYDKMTLEEKTLLKPEQIVDYLSLLGDSSDNIKGVEGLGKKTATDLLVKYKNIENIKNNFSSIKFRGSTGENFMNDYNNGKITNNKKLITLQTNLFNENINCLENKNFQDYLKLNSFPDSQILNNFIEKYGFYSWRKKEKLKP